MDSPPWEATLYTYFKQIKHSSLINNVQRGGYLQGFPSFPRRGIRAGGGE